MGELNGYIFALIGVIVAVASIILNLTKGTWKFTLFILVGIGMAVYGFLKERKKADGKQPERSNARHVGHVSSLAEHQKALGALSRQPIASSKQLAANSNQQTASTHPAIHHIPKNFCSNCGARLVHGAAFCQGCGHRV